MFVGVIAVALLGWSGVAFLAAVTATINIVVAPQQAAAPPPELGQAALGAGERIQVVSTPPLAAFTIHHGSPHKDTGRQIFRVQVDQTRSGEVGATFAWRNPGEGPFKNGFIEAALYFQIDCDLHNVATDLTMPVTAHTFNELGAGAVDNEGNVCFRPATNVSLLTSTVAVAELLPNGLADNHYLYLIASILNAGHNAPPGQQPDLGELKFLLLAR